MLSRLAPFVSASLLMAWGWNSALFLSAAAAEPPSFPVESFRLANGMNVALSHDAAAPRTTVCVVYHVGSKNERPGLTGFAHFFEHMMFRGTKNVPNFDVPLQQAGGSPNAFTSEDVTAYFETVPNNYVQRALYMEAERMAFLSSALDQEKFDTEREVVKNERRQTMENVPYGLASETLASLVYPQGHPYSWSVIGSMKDLSSATLDDLRQFFNEFYHPGNATLTLVGGFDPAQAKRWIETYFAPLPPGPALAALHVPAAAPHAQRVTQKDRVQFPRVYWAWPSVSEASPDAPALDLLAMILSDGDASRLDQALVIKSQAAVQVSASSDTSELDGMFRMTATAAPGHTIEEIEALIANVLADIRSTPPTAEELARARVKYRTGLLIGLTSPVRRTFVIGLGLAQHNDPHYYRSEFSKYETVTPADIQRVARQYLVDDKVALVIEPVEEGQEESSAVLAGPLPSDVARPPVEPQLPNDGPDWSIMPPPTQRTAFVAPKFERRKLRNGLEVWIVSWRTLPLVSARLLVRAGSACDVPEHAGLAELTSELWDQGTRELTATELAEALDALGTSLGVGAGADTTQLSFTVEKQALAATLNLVGQVVAAPRWDEVDFQREKQLQLSGLASGPDSAGWIASRVFPTLLYGWQHPLALPGTGYEDTVAGLSLDQVKQFYAQRFVPQSSVLVVVGDVEVDETLALLETSFGSWQGAAEPQPVPSPRPHADRSAVYLVDKPGAVQSVIAVGRTWRGRQDDSYFPGTVGNRIFGGDFLSRVNQNLRERNGFTYGARSGFSYNRSGGRWSLSTSVRSEVTGAALREIAREMADVRADRPLTAEEVEVARDAEGNVFPRTFETPESIVDALAQLATFQLPDDYYDHYVARLQAVDGDATNRVIAEVVDPADMVMLVVGDRGIVEPKLREAGFDRIEYVDTDGRPVGAEDR